MIFAFHFFFFFLISVALYPSVSHLVYGRRALLRMLVVRWWFVENHVELRRYCESRVLPSVGTADTAPCCCDAAGEPTGDGFAFASESC